ncbi:hypothetical protein [Campylobacter helveticus]|uniref:Invasion antigen I n=1 Tax=Campylobacter helveticus TaxID=28898 RepID=A0AAX2UJK2_9BACT|nr:hypothetical protein [Campylobacter helveticus]ARE80860.1 hypothetical protein CHELV3228_1279 [Campylobacter helveticus]MCR2060090.1 hypothetical protein [Campylobacter helveticus]MCR2061981.1 hypothetical protein [Campylobacter helveticus]MCR2063474.1 hypothetical protein [Campylobacter helveticus]MCR2066048.1 hypothetical protein [Campylobacter helveticus]
MQVDLKNYYSPYFQLKEEIRAKLSQDKTQILKEKSVEDSGEKEENSKLNAKDGKTLSKNEEEKIEGRKVEGDGLVDLYEKLQELLSEIAKLSAKMQNTKDERMKEVFLKQIMTLNAQVIEITNLIQELEAKSKASS